MIDGLKSILAAICMRKFTSFSLMEFGDLIVSCHMYVVLYMNLHESKLTIMDNSNYIFRAAKHDGRRLQGASKRNGRRGSGQ